MTSTSVLDPKPPYANSWLEGLVCADLRLFLEDPGEILERIRVSR